MCSLKIHLELHLEVPSIISLFSLSFVSHCVRSITSVLRTTGSKRQSEEYFQRKKGLSKTETIKVQILVAYNWFILTLKGQMFHFQDNAQN